MIKNIIILIVSFFIMACSNKMVQSGFSSIQVENLEIFNEKIKENLSSNNIEYIKENMEKSIINSHVIVEIEKIDFSNMNIFISKPVFVSENPTSILALNANDNTFYFELAYNYDYHSEKWLISSVKERR